MSLNRTILAATILGMGLVACAPASTWVPTTTPDPDLPMALTDPTEVVVPPLSESTLTPSAAAPLDPGPSPVPTPSMPPTLTATASTVPIHPGLIATLSTQPEKPNCDTLVAFSPDGKHVVHVCGALKVWNVATHQLEIELPFPHSSMCALGSAAFSPDGRYFALSVSSCWSEESDSGHLMVWDVDAWKQLGEWDLEYAHMVDPAQLPYVLPVSAFAFLPDSRRIVYANANRVSVLDLSATDFSQSLELGDAMYATELGVSSDGEQLFVLMRWDKTNDFPSNYATLYRLQEWSLSRKSLVQQTEFPIVKPADRPLSLHGTWLMQTDARAGTYTANDLVSGEVKDLPYRLGWRYLSDDGLWMACMRYLGYDDQAIEIWRTDSWRNVDTFRPNFAPNWYYPPVFLAFNPAGDILAIAHEGQLTLWGIADPDGR